MKFSIQINQLGIVESGLHESTDLTDWALLEYVFDWQANTRATRFNDHVWLNYAHFIKEMPLLGLGKKSSVSNRIKKLVGLGLLSLLHDDFKVFVRTQDLYLDVVKFRPGDVIKRPVNEIQRGVPENERGVPENEHILNNQLLNNQDQCVSLCAGAREEIVEPGIKAAAVCLAWMQMGIAQVNPSHPDLLAVIDGGATQAELDFAGMTARDLGKGFGYALGIVKSRLADRQRESSQPKSGVRHENSSRHSNTSRLEHSRQIGAHLDQLFEQEFGSQMGSGII